MDYTEQEKMIGGNLIGFNNKDRGERQPCSNSQWGKGEKQEKQEGLVHFDTGAEGDDLAHVTFFARAKRVKTKQGMGWRRLPKDWKTGIVVPLYKKENVIVTNNYRKIMLLATASKIYMEVLR